MYKAFEQRKQHDNKLSPAPEGTMWDDRDGEKDP